MRSGRSTGPPTRPTGKIDGWEVVLSPLEMPHPKRLDIATSSGYLRGRPYRRALGRDANRMGRGCGSLRAKAGSGHGQIGRVYGHQTDSGVYVVDEAAQWSGANVLITGGTGSFGTAILRYLLDMPDGPDRIAVFSRDELKQLEVRKTFDDPRVRGLIGDVRDLERLRRATHDVDVIIHAAALKQVDTAEYNPLEFVKTNVLGSQNVIEAAIDNHVGRVIALSTDKASSPINLYGATKLTADKLFIAGNHYAGRRNRTRFSVVRYGNVMGSRGSVIPHFMALAAQGLPLTLTDRRMTRFWISLDEAVEFVADSLTMMQGGELYVPKIPSCWLMDLVEAIAPGTEIVETGIRPGEKLHEEMISADDSRRTRDLGTRYLVEPMISEWGYHYGTVGIPVESGWSYRSDTNAERYQVDQIRTLLGLA